MIDERFVILGSLLNIAGSFHYIVGTLRGSTQPNRVTWFLWALAPFIAFTAMIQEGVGLSALTTFMVGFGPLMIFIASFVNRKAFWQVSKFDIVCGALSLVALGMLVVSGEGVIAVIFAILADALAAAPTLLKAYKEPHSERSLIFLLTATSALIAMLAIKKWEFVYYAFPMYILVLCVILFVLIKFPRLRFKTKSAAVESDSP